MSEIKYKATMYIRLSYADASEHESESAGNQRRMIREFAAGHPDIKLLSEHVDDGYSGVVFDRPAFQAMMQDVYDGKINCIIVKDLSRLGRDFVDTGRYLKQVFPAYGVRFIAINDNIDTANSNEADEIIAPLKNMINDQYSRDISIKTRSALENKRRHGDFVAAFTVYGYIKSPDDKNRLEVDPEAADIVRQIFKMKLDGFSAARIADSLNNMGILSPLEYKRAYGLPHAKKGYAYAANNLWSAHSILRILKNETYAGTLIQGKQTTPNYKLKDIVQKSQEDWARTENAHDAIISRNDFLTVQRLLLLDTRLTPGSSQVYLFSGLLVCGCCGNRMKRKTVPYRDKKYCYYACPAGKKNGCEQSGMLKKSDLTDFVLQSIRHHIDSIIDVETLIVDSDMDKLNRSIRQRCTHQMEQNQEKIKQFHEWNASLYESLIQQYIDQEEYKQLKGDYSLELERLESENILLQKEMESADGVRFDWLDIFQKYQGIQKLDRHAVVQLIQQIKIIGKTEIQIIFNYQSEYEDALSLLAMEKEAV